MTLRHPQGEGVAVSAYQSTMWASVHHMVNPPTLVLTPPWYTSPMIWLGWIVVATAFGIGVAILAVIAWAFIKAGRRL